MKPWWVKVGLGLLAVLWGVLWWRDHRPVPNLVRWVPLEQAEAEAQKRALPILYDFSADWCTPCRQMAREVFAEPADAAFINEHFVPAQIYSREDVNDGELTGIAAEIANKFNVHNYPTLVILKAGEPPRFKHGYGDREMLLAFLRTATKTTAAE